MPSAPVRRAKPTGATRSYVIVQMKLRDEHATRRRAARCALHRPQVPWRLRSLRTGAARTRRGGGLGGGGGELVALGSGREPVHTQRNALRGVAGHAPWRALACCRAPWVGVRAPRSQRGSAERKEVSSRKHIIHHS